MVKQGNSAGFVERMTELSQKLARINPAPTTAYKDMYNIAEGR
jgi:hypothetical protein